MAKWHRIECSDCGTVRYTRYGNTKYCELCRLIRNIRFVGDRTRKCGVSGKEFAPIDRNQLVSLECDPYARPGHPTGTCGECDTENTDLLGNMMHICFKCADDIKRRGKLYSQLLLKQRWVKEHPEEYPDEGPPPAPLTRKQKAEKAEEEIEKAAQEISEGKREAIAI